MFTQRWAGRSIARLAAASLLLGCASSACAASTMSGSSPSAPALTASTVPGSSPSAPVATASVTVTSRLDVSFESSNKLNAPGILDIYWPAKPGPWPVVVMFHGDPETVAKDYLSEYAEKVAASGFVVFVPNWAKHGGADFDWQALNSLSWRDQLLASARQSACAVEFARSHAAEYGGDPSTLVLFGHSAGANEASVVAFDRPEPTSGCLGSTSLGSISALVTWEGDWLLGDASNDERVAADPTSLDAITPWKHLADHRDLRVVMLVSEHPGPSLERDATDLSWLTPRDPTGSFRAKLQSMGVFDDGTIGVAEEQQLLFEALKAQGNPASLTVMPGSTHEFLSDAGWAVFLAAFREAAAKG